ncbi:MFS transporter [Actinophytocola sp. S1-96]|uniref:MFS transporter n=2 Tax=Actinophytocola gossypii TaxID=2812003 RepID=A0ABT2J7S9_9PSEU|nr:MFS transporter [Actinophytocola gossypii]
MTLVAGIWVKSLTGSSSAAAAVAVCIYAPSLFSPLAGLLVDRVRRRRFLVLVNLASSAALLPLLLVDSAGRVWLIYAAMLAYGISLVLVDPAENALFAVMLPPDVRRSVNGLRLALQEGGKLVAPALGAGLYVLVGGGAVAAVDAATFALAAFAMTRLRFDEPKPTRTRRRWRAELLAGFRHVRAVPVLRSTAVAAAVAMVVAGCVTAAQYELVDALHQPPGFLGVLTGLLGAGSVVAGLVSGRLVRRLGERRLAVLGLVNGALGYLLYLTALLPAALVGAFVLGFALPWTVVAVINLAQRTTPNDLQGRVSSVVTLLLFAPQPLAHAFGAFAIATIDFRILYIAAAAVTLSAALWLSRRPELIENSGNRDDSPRVGVAK